MLPRGAQVSAELRFTWIHTREWSKSDNHKATAHDELDIGVAVVLLADDITNRGRSLPCGSGSGAGSGCRPFVVDVESRLNTTSKEGRGQLEEHWRAGNPQMARRLL